MPDIHEMKKYLFQIFNFHPRVGFAGILIVVLFCMTQGVFAASFKVSPTRFEFSLEKRFTNFFTLSNDSGETLRLRAFIGFYDFDSNDKLVAVKGHKLDLGKYIVINPRRINLRPGQSRIVRFSVRPPRAMEPGEYRAVMFFDELPAISGKKPTPATGPKPGFSNMRIEFVTRVGITLYGMKGEPQREAELREPSARVEGDQVVVTGKAVNKGNVRLTLTISAQLQNQEGDNIHSAEKTIFVQRSQMREFNFSFPKPPPGKYEVLISGTDGDSVTFESVVALQPGSTPN